MLENVNMIALIAEVILGGGGLVALFRFFRDRKRDSYHADRVRIENDEKRVQSAYAGQQLAEKRAEAMTARADTAREQLEKERQERFEEERDLREEIAQLRAKLLQNGIQP